MDLKKYHEVLKDAAAMIDEARYRTAEIKVHAMLDCPDADDLRIRDKMASTLTDAAAKNTIYELRQISNNLAKLAAEEE